MEKPEFFAPKLTVQCMVRDEEWTIWEALMSTIPYCKTAVIIDTGSTDRTKSLIVDVIARFPDKNIQYLQKYLPNMQVWGSNTPFMPSHEVGSVRNVMQAMSAPDEYIFTVDADEVWPKDSMRHLVRIVNELPPHIDCCYIPLHWMGSSPTRVCEIAESPVYHITGRIFKNRPGYEHRGVFPGECAHYDGVIPRPGERNTLQLNYEPWMLHYEMTTKPWRRRLVKEKPYTGIIPEVFELKKQLLGWSLMHDFHPNLIKKPF